MGRLVVGRRRFWGYSEFTGLVLRSMLGRILGTHLGTHFCHLAGFGIWFGRLIWMVWILGVSSGAALLHFVLEGWKQPGMGLEFLGGVVGQDTVWKAAVIHHDEPQHWSMSIGTGPREYGGVGARKACWKAAGKLLRSRSGRRRSLGATRRHAVDRGVWGMKHTPLTPTVLRVASQLPAVLIASLLFGPNASASFPPQSDLTFERQLQAIK
jgi:hypothetical protein